MKPESYHGDRVERSDEQWSKELSSEEFRILRQKGTEKAFTGKYYGNHEIGLYRCAACGLPLFDSEDKYDSGSGWPSFVKPLHLKGDEERVRENRDTSHNMIRTEILCARCGGHLGHVFPDGPGPGGLRYCINSASLKFEKKDD